MSELSSEAAWSYALDLLSRRSYTVSEIRERLARKGAARVVIDQTIGRLEQYRFVDDRAYAELFVGTRQRRKGSIALRHELQRKGIEETVATTALGALDDTTELSNAAALLQRNAWRFRGPNQIRNRSRAFAFLARRGFPSEIASSAIEDCAWLAGTD